MNETPFSVGYMQPQQQNSFNSGNKECGWKDEQTFYRRHYYWNCYIGWEHYKHNNITYFSKYCNTYMNWKPVDYLRYQSLPFFHTCLHVRHGKWLWQWRLPAHEKHVQLFFWSHFSGWTCQTCAVYKQFAKSPKNHTFSSLFKKQPPFSHI